MTWSPLQVLHLWYETELTIQEVAKRMGLSIDTLRYYERIGLLEPIGRSQSGHRRYTQQDLDWIDLLIGLRNTGMPLAQMARLAQLRRQGFAATLTERRLIYEHYQRTLRQHMQQLEQHMTTVENKIAHLREAVQVILAMWTQEEAVFEGKYYQVRGAINQPRGVQQPHIPLLIGGGGEKVTLKLVAQYADACNVFGDLETIKHKFAVIKEYCATVGRDYESIHRTAGTFCSIAETDEQARAKFPAALLSRFGNMADSVLVGNPDTIRKRLAAFEAQGVQELIIGFPGVPQLDSLRFFASECLA